MVDPTLSYDLPPFLTADPGLNSGFMIAEVTTAALMSENKHLATPCSTNSTPTRANQEDHVSMAAHGARRLRADGGEPRAHPRHRGALRRPGHRVPRAAHHQPAARARRWPASAPRSRRSPRTASSRPTSRPPPRLVRDGALLAASGVAFPELVAMTPVEVTRGDGPVILGLPHTGTWLPEDAVARLNDTGRALADTDWHVARALRRPPARRDHGPRRPSTAT